MPAHAGSFTITTRGKVTCVYKGVQRDRHYRLANIQAMKTKTVIPAPDYVSEWTKELWEAEAKYTATIGSRLKFGLPLAPARPKRTRARTAKRATTKA